MRLQTSIHFNKSLLIRPFLSNSTIKLDNRFLEFLKTMEKILSVEGEYLEQLFNKSVRNKE